MRQFRDLQMLGSRGCEASRSAGQSDGFFGFRPLQIHRDCAERHLSFSAWFEQCAYLAGSWVDGYRHALRHRNYADSCVYDFGGMRKGEIIQSSVFMRLIMSFAVAVAVIGSIFS